MKKLLGAVLSLALLIPSGPASAELFKNLKLDGWLDVRMDSSYNIKDFSTRAPDVAPAAYTTSL